MAIAHLLDLQTIAVKLLMPRKEFSRAERSQCKLQISVCVSQVSALTMPTVDTVGLDRQIVTGQGGVVLN